MTSLGWALVVTASLGLLTALAGAPHAAAQTPCLAGETRIVDYGFLVEDESRKRLPVLVGPERDLVVWATLVQCDLSVRTVTFTEPLHACGSPEAAATLDRLSALNSDSVDDDLEAAMLGQVRTAMGCHETPRDPVLEATIVGTTFASIGILVTTALVRRRGR